MQKIKFETDYQEGCHPKVLELLTRSNYEQTSGYGVDPHTERAKELIRKFINRPDSEIFFLVGGTQTNATVIKYFLNPCEGVISVSTGHINVHESGAIEATGHKILTIPGHDGLLDPEDLSKYLADFYADPTYDHMVQPGLVYISFSSELGTLYTLNMLEAIRKVCDEYNLRLFIDGARLGAGLVSEANDVSIDDICRLSDAFYLGGTKNGALFGEAVVFPNPEKFNLRTFRTLIKQQGGLLAKGRLLGIQFEALFDDDLYLQNSRHAYNQAMKIKQAFKSAGIPFLIESFTNQQFPILTQEQNKILSAKFDYELWQPLPDNKMAVRFCTSWATTDEAIEKLVQEIKTLS
ncbi:MAG: aminotransferase class V-fold PLP-dependent enzyme [Synergistaceae bacterium]|nr:aminotransferase class V-fold PLP-dependent enzyme [Synergistaceae bacterium]